MEAKIIEKNDENLLQIADYFKRGLVGAIVTDTIYGLSAIVNEETKERIFEIKNRQKGKNFIELMTLNDLKNSSLDVPEVLFDVYPESLTAILSDKSGGTKAIRVPKDEYMLKLLELTGPLFSTSANISGEKSLLNFFDIYDTFKSSLDFIVKSDDVREGLASTIIDMSKKPYRIIRQGSFDASSLI